MSRMLRFVQAARALLWMQLAAAMLATALAIWALLAVRDLAIERDRLLVEVAELERARPGPVPVASANGIVPSSLDREVRPPAIMPVFVPIVTGPEIPNIPPVDIPPPETVPETPAPAPTPPQDCTGNPNQPRCRPGRWSRRDPSVEVRPVLEDVRDTPQRPGTDTPPR